MGPAPVIRTCKDALPITWAEILNQHASLIMRTASQFEYHQDRKNDSFLFVCEKLS